MIEFSCACQQYRFSLPEDMAGGLIQCPRCRRLVDVPTLGEMNRLDADGGYKFEDEAPPPPADASRLGQVTRAFTRDKVDDFGNEIDMRATFEDIQRAGVINTPGHLDNGKIVSPKYDPLTGELVRPLPVSGEAPRQAIALHPRGAATADEKPLAALPVVQKLNYAVVPAANISLAGPFLQLLRPVNLVVMAFVVLGHAIVHVTGVIVMVGMIFLAIAPLIAVFALIGHYGNVIDEIGPSGRDELPAPIRNASFYDDIWRPFIQVMTALFMAYLPAIFVSKMNLPPDALTVTFYAFIVLGSLAFPALVLTQVTSGTFENARPDRVLGVIRTCGLKYAFVCLVYLAAAFAYVAGWAIIMEGTALLFRSKAIVKSMSVIGTGYGVLALAIFLAHAVCWMLGLLYRTYHERFPWIMQRHVPTRLAERTRPRAGHLITPVPKPAAARHQSAPRLR